MIHETISMFPLTNPVLKFSLLLFIILMAPYLFKKIKIPTTIGLIISGAIIGPHGINFMQRDSSIILYGTVGLLYIMFIAGLEIDLADFKKNSHKSVIFGVYSFLIPMILGIIGMYYLHNFSIMTSVLIASLFASHTLVTYPIVNTLGISKNRAVNITIGGTLVTDILALLVLTVIVGMSNSVINLQFWVDLVIKISMFTVVVALVLPKITRYFLKREDDNVSQYIFVLGIVFLSAFLAEIAGVEAIIGAFLAGLALNQLIPRASGLMNRIEFIGNALFIPIFLIGVGMLINFKTIFTDISTLFIGVTMIIIATGSKYLAAYLTQKSFKYTLDERRVIFGLSNSRVAATLAAVLVGYNLILGYDQNSEPIRLISEKVLDGTIFMILFTCTIASFATQKGAYNLSLLEKKSIDVNNPAEDERILIPISLPDNMNELIHLGLNLKSKGSANELFALRVLSSDVIDEKEEKIAKEMLDQAEQYVSATDHKLHKLMRYDINTGISITNVIKEYRITDLIIGLHHKKGLNDSFLGKLTENILSKTPVNTFIYHSIQPAHTMQRLVLVFPDHAEKEPGFQSIMNRIWNFCINNGLKVVIFSSQNTYKIIQLFKEKRSLETEFIEFSEWDDFLIVSSKIQENDGLMIIMSRVGMISYNSSMLKLSKYLVKYFSKNNYFLVYPLQNYNSKVASVSSNLFFMKNINSKLAFNRKDKL